MQEIDSLVATVLTKRTGIGINVAKDGTVSTLPNLHTCSSFHQLIFNPFNANPSTLYQTVSGEILLSFPNKIGFFPKGVRHSSHILVNFEVADT